MSNVVKIVAKDVWWVHYPKFISGFQVIFYEHEVYTGVIHLLFL